MNHLSRKQWQIAPRAPDKFIDALKQRGYPPVLAQILYLRGYTTPETAFGFFDHYDEDDNPFRLKGMTEAVFRLRMAIRRGEPVAVYGDFDADGVTSTVLLTEVLKHLGADVRPYIPDRVDEGYGLNSPALRHLADQGVKVVVTVDCGIRSVREVEDGSSYGLDMIISDHHSVGPVLPPALAVINPKQPGCNYPEKMLAGVGLAYKIAQGLYMEAQRRGYKKDDPWHPDDWLDLVAVGTVADIAPLRGENRELVIRGLARLNHPRRPGLRALYGAAGIKVGQIDATAIGFQIGPRVNAAGRLKSAMLAFDLLAAEDTGSAARLAQQLNDLNRLRQQKTADMQAQAEGLMPGDPADEPLLFAAAPEFEQGVVGLVASRLTEQYYRPSVVVHINDEESHGSCRSIPEFHIMRALEQCDFLLEKYGGHAAAAGFTVRNENIEQLKERLWDLAAEELADAQLVPTLQVDAALRLEEIGVSLYDALSRLEPTGEANPAPLFIVSGVHIAEKQPVGAENRHLKLVFTDGQNSIEGIAFRWGEQVELLPDEVDIICRVEMNEWNGKNRLQLNVQDFRPAHAE